ncbi:MAG: NAD(P)/FAD-dependent oxidoreductase [Myxococcota bacterium]
MGSGISGISAGYHLGRHCPGRRYVVLEGRDDLGGTWDLFRYPGIRSDSDMHTLGYSFRPWTEDASIATGDSILQYLRSTATEYGIDQHIRFGHRVTGARWSSADNRWRVEVRQGASGRTVELTCNFMFLCCGYYDYAQGYTPDFPGTERFTGRIVHPQHWTEDIEYEGQRVVVIGSGATAVTLIPALAERAAHVTMLQRSPSYILSRPSQDAIALWLGRILPPRVAYRLTRWKNVTLGMLIYSLCRRAPEHLRRMLIEGVREQLPPGYDVKTHFSPRYAPWDERLCLAPNGDLFEAIRDGRASVVTDHVETFTERGILLRSGDELPADLIVTATGLQLRFLGGIDLEVDGQAVDLPDTMTYKAMMLSDVPNLALWTGYTNASWTLKADLTGEYVCRLLNYMDDHGHRRFVPRCREPDMAQTPLLDLKSGYIQRARAMMPKQGTKAPWRLRQSYLLDLLTLRYGAVNDEAMELG